MSVRRCFVPLCVLALLVAIYFPARHARRYGYVHDDRVLGELVREKIAPRPHNLQACDYAQLIANGTDFDVDYVLQTHTYAPPDPGGVYSPKDCAAFIKAAIIIPYRNRPEQLHTFLNYIHHFLQRQLIEYRIIVVDQNDTLPFNRAKMLNYGAKMAENLNYSCLILHDVDLMPLNVANIYGCTKKPRHMSSSLDTFRFNLPYLTLFGGAISITTSQFNLVNGYSNNYYGWGGEDDDFYIRLQNYNLQPCRFSPAISKYVMLNHKKEKASKERYQLLKDVGNRQETDGVRQLKYYSYSIEPLYTHVLAT